MQRSKELADRQNDLIRAIYQAGAGMTSVSEALQALAVQTSSDKAFWGCFDLGRGVGEIVDGYNADPAWVSRYNHVVSGQNVWMRKRNYFKAEGVVWRGARIVPMHELTQSEFYEQILAPQAIHHTLHLVVAVEGETIAHILLTRRRSEPDYGKSELELARSFAVHARHALDIRRALARTRMVQAVLTDVVADTALGVAVLDPPFIIYASETCQAMLASLGADSASNGVLFRQLNSPSTPFYLPRDLADAVARNEGLGPTSTIIKPANTNHRYVVHIKPFPFQDATQSEGRVATALVIYDPDRRSSINEELLQSAYEMTKSEARVCSLLANGRSVDEISNDLQISPHTVRTHLQRIFKKTGSIRQMDLVKLVLNTATLRRTNQALSTEIGRARRTRPLTGHDKLPAFTPSPIGNGRNLSWAHPVAPTVTTPQTGLPNGGLTGKAPGVR